MLRAALGASNRHRGLNHEYMAQPGGLRRPLRGAGRKEDRTAKQPNSRADHIGLTQANQPPRKPVRFTIEGAWGTAYRVSFTRHGENIAKLFLARDYDNAKAALKAARAWRDSMTNRYCRR